MAKISPNFVVGVNSADTQNPSKRSAPKGGEQFVAATDRLELGTEKVSIEEAVRILVERVTSRLYDALREARIDVSRGSAPNVPADSSPEVIAQRILSFAASFLDEFQASQTSLDQSVSREQFARLVGEAISKGFSDTQNLLRGLKVFLSNETSVKIEKIESIIAKMLENFVAEGEEAMQAEDHSSTSPAGGSRLPPANPKQPSSFVPRSAEGGEVANAQQFEARAEGTPLTEASQLDGPQKANATQDARAHWPDHAQKGEPLAKEMPAVESRPHGPFKAWAEGSAVHAQEAQVAGEGNATEGSGRLLLGGEMASTEQVIRTMAERVISNVKNLMSKIGVESSTPPIVELPAASPPETAVQRIYDFMLSSFNNFQKETDFASELQGRVYFGGLIGEATNRAISDTRAYFQNMHLVFSEDAAGSVEKLRNLLAKMVDEFVAEGLRDPSWKTQFVDPTPGRSPQASLEQGRGANLVPLENQAMGASIPAEHSTSASQAQLIPPESTVLAMTKRALSQRMYGKTGLGTNLQTVVYHPPQHSLLTTLFSIAVILNYPWELAHLFLYRWSEVTLAAVALTCFKAALGDGLLVLALYGMGCALFKHRGWILDPGPVGYAYLAFSGMAVAIGIEWHASVWGQWAYTSFVPLLPVVGVGLFPVLQMMILTPLIAYATRLWFVMPR